MHPPWINREPVVSSTSFLEIVVRDPKNIHIFSNEQVNNDGKERTCIVKRCKENHSRHYCKFCKDKDSDHFSNQC